MKEFVLGPCFQRDRPQQRGRHGNRQLEQKRERSDLLSCSGNERVKWKLCKDIVLKSTPSVILPLRRLWFYHIPSCSHTQEITFQICEPVEIIFTQIFRSNNTYSQMLRETAMKLLLLILCDTLLMVKSCLGKTT